jgi:hypothetical protein
MGVALHELECHLSLVGDTSQMVRTININPAALSDGPTLAGRTLTEYLQDN